MQQILGSHCRAVAGLAEVRVIAELFRANRLRARSRVPDREVDLALVCRILLARTPKVRALQRRRAMARSNLRRVTMLHRQVHRLRRVMRKKQPRGKVNHSSRCKEHLLIQLCALPD